MIEKQKCLKRMCQGKKKIPAMAIRKYQKHGQIKWSDLMAITKVPRTWANRMV